MLTNFQKKFKKDKEIYLRVKVLPRMPKTTIKDILEDKTIKINLCAIPEKNKANKELISFLAKEFNVFKKNVIILSGKSSRLKLIKICSEEKKHYTRGEVTSCILI